MAVEIYWRLPLHGCHGYLGGSSNRGDWSPLAPGNFAPRAVAGGNDGVPYIEHVAEIAKMAELSGFYGALVISFPNTEEAWAVSSTLARETRSLRFMIAFQPNFVHPVQIASQAATLQRLTHGRVVWNVISGGGGPAQRWYGDFLAHDQRYLRTKEFLEIIELEFAGRPYDYDGTIFQVEGGGLHPPFSHEKRPKIYLSGSSDAALDTAAGRAETLLNWLEPEVALRANLQRIAAKTVQTGKALSYALRIEVLARPTEEEAWREVERAWERLDPVAVAVRLATGGASDSVGAARQRGFRPDTVRDWRDLRAAGNRWGGFHLLRGGPPWGLVGSYEQVAEQLQCLIDLGVSAFVLAGTPHLEEAQRVGENVLPLLDRVRRPPAFAA